MWGAGVWERATIVFGRAARSGCAEAPSGRKAIADAVRRRRDCLRRDFDFFMEGSMVHRYGNLN